VEALANRGVIEALSIDHHLRNGLSVHKGVLTSKPVAQAQGLDFASAEELLMA
jgi:alanine dehydrogenase